MSIGQALKRRGKAIVFPTVFMAITAFFGWSATRGDRGLVAFAQRQTLLQQVQADEQAARAERDAWQVRVAGLRKEHLNADTLDERARQMLNLADPSEVIVKYAPQDKLF
jgi:cell division protein FtsB